MTVKVSKPAINVREELADLKKPTGIAGEAMLRAETPQEQFNLIGAGRRNLIINGDFQVSQRGTSISGTTYFYGAADRWQGYGYATNSCTVAVVDSREVLPDGSAISRYLSVTSTNNRVFVMQNVENVAQFNKQTLTLSGWVKCPSGNACIGTDLEMGGALNYGSGGSTAEGITGFGDGTKSGTVISDKWQKFTKTITIPDISAKTFGASNTSRLDFYLTSDSVAGTLHFANVQLELGKVATPFEHRSYGEELALCQRYYEVLAAGQNNTASDTGNLLGNFSQYSSTLAIGIVPYKVPKRAVPTGIVQGATSFRIYSNGGNSTATAVNVDGDTSLTKARIDITVSRTVGHALWVRGQGNNCLIAVDAEL